MSTAPGTAGWTPVVDLHAHVFFPDLPDLAAETGDPRWPRLVPGIVDGHSDADRGEVWRGEDRFRVVRRPFWDAEARVAEMDQLGTDVQVVSPIPVAVTYWADGSDALRFAREQNDRIAATVADSGGRLLGLGTVPLQDPTAAADELARITGPLGLAGAEIGTVVQGAELDHPELRPFFRAAAELRAPLFLHPIDGSGVLRCSDPHTDFAIGMHTDTALAAKALVYGGVLAELPELRVCLAHGGGAFPWTHPRLRWRAAATSAADPADLDALVRRLWADCLVFDPLPFGVLAARYGPDHLTLGSDYPFIDHDPTGPLDDAVVAGSITAAEATAIRGPNALAFLGLGP
ncbi:MAG: amidohydrolase [Acidimicrobiia bacterium]|nr:amidohydrolase [Acidimicrobiia bacterium]